MSPHSQTFQTLITDEHEDDISTPHGGAIGKKFELDRLSNNRIIRKKIKDLKDKKSSMSRSEVIKSGIVKEISELKKSIG